jgi:hypothetical protein
MKKLIAVMLLFGCWSVQASTVYSNTCSTNPSYICITGIDGLEIEGQVYNMTVLTGKIDELFSDPAEELKSWGDYSWSTSASVAIEAALNELIPMPTWETHKFVETETNYVGFYLHLPTEDHATFPEDFFSSRCVYPYEVSAAASDCGKWAKDELLAFATFTVVPIPASVWLFGSAIAGLGWLRRRQTA